MKRVLIDGAGEPIGHYTPAVEAGGLIFASGLLPMDLKSGKPVSGDTEEQLKALFENVGALLDAAGLRKEDVVKATAYVSDVAFWAAFNEAYCAFFGLHKPARTVVPLGGKLHYGLDFEMEFIAERKS